MRQLKVLSLVAMLVSLAFFVMATVAYPQTKPGRLFEDGPPFNPPAKPPANPVHPPATLPATPPAAQDKVDNTDIPATADAPQPQSEPTTVKLPPGLAEEAHRRYVQDEQAAAKVYANVMADATKRYVATLQRAQEQATRAGKLDDAIAIRDVLATLTAPTKPTVPVKPNRSLAGSVWKHTGGWTMILHPDMSAETTHFQKPGTWVQLDERTVRLSVSMHDRSGYPATLTPDGKQLLGMSGELQFTRIK